MLKDRINLIIQELNIKQKIFAQSIGVSENYISQLINGKRTAISESLAILIECKYGYSSSWITKGIGEKFSNHKSSFAKQRVITLIKGLSEEHVQAVLTFVYSLDEVKRILEQANSVQELVAEPPAADQRIHTTAARNDAPQTEEEQPLARDDIDEL